MGAFLFLPMIKGFLSSCRGESVLYRMQVYFILWITTKYFTEFAIPGKGTETGTFIQLCLLRQSAFALIILFITRDKSIGSYESVLLYCQQ